MESPKSTDNEPTSLVVRKGPDDQPRLRSRRESTTSSNASRGARSRRFESDSSPPSSYVSSYTPSSPRPRPPSPDHHHRRRRRQQHREVDNGSDSLSSDTVRERPGRRTRERREEHRPRREARDRDGDARRASVFSSEDLRHPGHPDAGDDKPWFKKKTLWASVATVATVAALLPASFSAKGSREAASASQEAARASKRSADAVEKSAKAVVNTSIAQGHQDAKGRYAGPKEHLSGGNNKASASRGRSGR